MEAAVLEAALAKDAARYRELSDDDIMRVMGVTARIMERTPNARPQLESATPQEVLEAVSGDEQLEGFSDVVMSAARRIFRHAETMAFEMACGDNAEFAPLRRKLAEKIAKDEDVSDIAGALAAAFVSWLGLAQNFAAGAAVIIARRMIDGALEGFCDAWSRRRAGSGGLTEV